MLENKVIVLHQLAISSIEIIEMPVTEKFSRPSGNANMYWYVTEYPRCAVNHKISSIYDKIEEKLRSILLLLCEICSSRVQSSCLELRSPSLLF